MTDEATVAVSDIIEPAAQAETPAAPTTDTSKTEAGATPKVEGVLDSKEIKSDVKPDWPEDWLDKLAGGDDKIKERFGKYASPKAVGEALLAAQKKISSYKPQIELPKDPKPEDIEAYRKAYGIPEKPEGYDIKLDNGIVIGDADKPLVDKFLAKAHAAHLKPDEIKRAFQIHFENLQEQNDEINANFTKQRTEGEDALRAEWGNDFRQNKNIIDNFLTNKFGDETSQALTSAVLGDGTLLSHNPKVVRALLSIAKEIDPVATLGGSSNTTASSIESELNDITKIMRENPSAYFADKNKVKRFEELTIANEKLKSRK